MITNFQFQEIDKRVDFITVDEKSRLLANSLANFDRPEFKNNRDADNRRKLERNLSLLLEKQVNVTNFKMLNAAEKARYTLNGRMNLRTITQSIALTANTTARMSEEKENNTED